MRVKELRSKRIATEISTTLLAAKASATDRLTPDLPSPPVDALDLVIRALDNVIPVFDEQRLDLGVNTRYVSAQARFISGIAKEIESTTQNERRRKIIPASPGFLRLKESANRACQQIESLYQRELSSENPNASGRQFLAGLSKQHIGGLVAAIANLETHWGNFHIWIRQPKRALCNSLVDAWRREEKDSEELLTWFRKEHLHVLGAELDPYIAQVLLGMRVSGSSIILPGDLRNLAHLSEGEIARAIIRMARCRKWADEDGDRDRVRLTVKRDADGKEIRRYAQSLDAENKAGMTLKDKLPDIARDPIEFLFSSRQSIKLQDLAAMRNELFAHERWSQLNPTPDEYLYITLHHGFGITQEGVREKLNWDSLRIQAVRRNADLKLKKCRAIRTAEDRKTINKI